MREFETGFCDHLSKARLGVDAQPGFAPGVDGSTRLGALAKKAHDPAPLGGVDSGVKADGLVVAPQRLQHDSRRVG